MSQRILALVAITVLSSIQPLAAQRASITGTLSYRERLILPLTAVAEITLEDVSRADAPPEVVARLRQSLPAQPPVPFELPFDGRRINPRSRYAVRARIFDGDRVLFATVGTSLVLTQGKSATADLVLQMTSAAEAARSDAMPPTPAAARMLPPVVELRNLPAAFIGTLPCDGCSGLRYELNLFPDDSFFLRTTRLGRAAVRQDDLGSWVLSSDRRAIVLRTSRGKTEIFAIRDSTTLRKLDEAGQEISSKKPYDLRRSQTFAPLELRVSVGGAYARTLEGARFVECSTGQSWSVAEEGAGRDLSLPAVASPRQASSRFISLEGRLVSRRRADRQDTEPVFVVERVDQAIATQTCAPRFASLPLVGTYWQLRNLGAAPVATAPGSRNEPSIVFRDEPRSFGGTGGCNRLAGRYHVGDDALMMAVAGTMMACPSGSETETGFARALSSTRRHRILGTTLELFDDQQQVLARFEGRP